MAFFVSMTNASIKACISLVKPRIHYLSIFCIIYNTLIACETHGHFSQGVFQIEEHLTLENTIITRLNLSKPLWLQRLKCELLVVFHIQLRARVRPKSIIQHVAQPMYFTENILKSDQHAFCQGPLVLL